MEQEIKRKFECGKTSLSREDILMIGYRGDKVDDETMQSFADQLEEKMKDVFGDDWDWNDEYTESVWWNELDELCYVNCEFVGEYN